MYKQDNRARNVRDRKKYANLLAVIKVTAGCRRCGYDEYACALDFHHRDPATKSFKLGTAAPRRALRTTFAEVEKCDVLCAICHRLEHSGVVS